MLHSIVISDGEDALKHVISRAAGKADLPCETTPVDRHEVNGRVERRDKHRRELLQVVIEDARGWWCGEAELL